MSNKRPKRTEAEFFVYEPGVDVPRDVTHILVHPSVKVLPEGMFRGLVRLKEVVLPDGLQEIGQFALRDCQSLEHISFPRNLIRIHSSGFVGCTSLTALHFREGLVEICASAFEGCTALTRVSLSSTVTVIGNDAFFGCSSLAMLILVDGLRTIGGQAFWGCELEHIVLPATLTDIGCHAFGHCRSLRIAKLGGGIQLIEWNAFMECDLLNHVRVTPKSLVITITEDGDDFDFEFAAGGTVAPRSSSDRVVITSECFYSMSSEEVSALEVGISEILRMQLEWGGKHERLRRLVAVHERRRKEEVASLLKLGVREAEMRRLGAMGLGTREESPLTCKMDVIVGNVVAFL